MTINRKDVEAFRGGDYDQAGLMDEYQRIATKSAIYPGKGTPFGLMYAALSQPEGSDRLNAFRSAAISHA